MVRFKVSDRVSVSQSALDPQIRRFGQATGMSVLDSNSSAAILSKRRGADYETVSMGHRADHDGNKIKRLHIVCMGFET